MILSHREKLNPWKICHKNDKLMPCFCGQQKAPQVVLQSLYHNNGQAPISKELTDLKYSPQWKPEGMVKQMTEGILANISSFQMTSTRNSSISRRLE